MIRFRRQKGGMACDEVANAPKTLGYGEPAIDSAGTIYVGNGKGEVASKVKHAERAKYDMPLYSVFLSVDKWETSGELYTQTAACTPVDGGPPVTNTMMPSAPMTKSTTNQETSDALFRTLNIINRGVSEPEAGEMTVKVWKKPTTDIVVYYYIR